MNAILAVETSTPACSVALRLGDMVISRYSEEPRSHTKLVMNMISEVLAEASLSVQQLDTLAVTVGPGSFTGLRIGFAAVQGMAFGADKPVVPASSLQVMTATYLRKNPADQDAGMVIMNQAFQATVVDTINSRPLKPVIVDIDESYINNLLIISKPREIVEAIQNEELNKVATALDIDFLKFEELEIDYLEIEEDQYVTMLDTDFLDQNFLADVLEQLNRQLALQMRSEFDKKKTQYDFTLGKDKETGITILDEDPQWYWHREAASGSVVELRLEQENSYMMNIQMGDFQLIDFELGGIESEITIIQSQ